MSLQNILINQSIRDVQSNPSNSSRALSKTLMIPKLDLDENLIYLFNLCLETLQIAGVDQITNYLYKISLTLKNSHLLDSFIEPLIHWDKSSVLKLLKWNKSLISNRKIQDSITYSPKDSIFFDSIFNSLIAKQDRFTLELIVSNLIINEPKYTSNILSHFKEKNIKLNISDTVKTVLDSGHSVDVFEGVIDLLGSVTKYNLDLYKILVSKSNKKINTSKLYLNNLTNIKYYLIELVGFIQNQDLSEIFEYLNEVYQHRFIDKSIITSILSNRNLSPEVIFNSIPNQSIYNSIINSFSNLFFDLHDLDYIETIFYFAVYSHYFKTCYNKSVINDLIFNIVKLQKNRRTDDLKLAVLSFIDLGKYDISHSFWSSFSKNKFETGKADFILKQLIPHGYSKVDCIDFLSKTLVSSSKKNFDKFFNSQIFSFFSRKYQTKEFIKGMINDYGFAYKFVKLKRKYVKNDFISNYDAKDLRLVAWKKLTLLQKIKCFFDY